MKKTIKVAVCVLVALVIGSIIPAFGQDNGGGSGGGNATIGLPMIKSPDVLRNYAQSIAKFGERHAWAESLDWQWSENKNHARASGNYGEQVLASLFGSELVYRLTNPADEIRGYVYLYDNDPFAGSDGANLLFFGSATYTVAELATNKPLYNIWMQNIPLPTVGVTAAEVLVLNEEDQTVRREQLTVRNGKVLFPSWMAGAANGILVTRNEEGVLASYRLDNPVGTVPVGQEDDDANYKVAGHYIYKVTERPMTVKIVETWELPSVFIDVRASQVVTIDVMGLVQGEVDPLLERPVSMEIAVEQDGVTTVGTVQLNTTRPTELRFVPGTYRIRFNWNLYGHKNWLYDGPVVGVGEKG